MSENSELRILSLIASATEIVCALGFRDQLVGRSHECDFPADVAGLPAATVPKIEVGASSREIDDQVKEAVRGSDAIDALGVYDVRLEVLTELNPTHIVTQTQCEVCAVSLRDVEAAVGKIAGVEPEIVSLQPNALDDVWGDVMRVATSFGAQERGYELVAELQERMARINEVVVDLEGRPSVAVIEWVDPMMAGGNWMPTLVEMAGGRSLFGKAGLHSPWMTFEELRAADPDVILIAPCGFDMERAQVDVPILESKRGWSDLSAVRAGRVYVADGNQYFNRPGPRLAETLEILAEILHPGQFDFGHKGAAWEAVHDASPQSPSERAGCDSDQKVISVSSSTLSSSIS